MAKLVGSISLTLSFVFLLYADDALYGTPLHSTQGNTSSSAQPGAATLPAAREGKRGARL